MTPRRPERMRPVALVAMVLLASSCGSERTAPPPPERVALGGEVAARVGTDVIPLSLVVKVAVAQHITPREALSRLVDDAICANAARARGLDLERTASWLLTAARARTTADRIRAEALQAGPPTDTEIADLTKQYWREVDRPEAVRVVHALAGKSDPKKPDAAVDARAQAAAPELRAALLDAHDADDFIAKGKAFPHSGFEIAAQKLPAFAANSAITEGGGGMDPAFVKGAFALTTPGETSPIVESSFGWHVIRLVERVPEQRMALEARRIAFTEEAYMNRAQRLTEGRIAALRATHPLQISDHADNLTRTLSAKPDRGPVP